MKQESLPVLEQHRTLLSYNVMTACHAGRIRAARLQCQIMSSSTEHDGAIIFQKRSQNLPVHPKLTICPGGINITMGLRTGARAHGKESESASESEPKPQSRSARNRWRQVLSKSSCVPTVVAKRSEPSATESEAGSADKGRHWNLDQSSNCI